MPKKVLEKTAKYHLSEQGEFIIENYNYAKPMANFFPGIAGKYGIPMWVFYVNRGQAISCFGTDGKDHAILEFQPADKAWQQTSLLGFRTFIKSCDKKIGWFYEPFHNGLSSLGFDLSNKMAMTSYDLKLAEENKTLGLLTQVKYFTIPQDNYAGLVRVLTIKNIGRKTRKIQVLDGLPKIVPYGIANLFLKKLSRTIEAWMRVENLENGVPFYKVNVDPIDRAYVIHIKEGNFFLGFHQEKNKTRIIRPIVDPEPIFGQINDFSCPRQFIAKQDFAYPKKQQTQCKTPCGFMLLDLDLKPGQEKTVYSITGNARNIEFLNSSVKRIASTQYLKEKEQENKIIIQQLQADMQTKSSSWEFDYYCKQTYLDNIMRGGYPITFESDSHRTVFYLYSRKHGDLERDYNKFQIQPTYFSQGNGNYRDMNQNRRSDTWFNPRIGDYNVITFTNLIQIDGFNPLVVKGATFSLKEKETFKNRLADVTDSKESEKILKILEKPFTPGQIVLFLEENKIKLSIPQEEFLNILLSLSIKNPEADHGEGFWTDHWTYNLDLLESYLEIYPEKLKEIVFDKKVFTFYDNDAVVQPRSAKYILLDGQPRQLHSVVRDQQKKDMILQRADQPHTVRTEYGKGQIYKCTLINKFVCIFANKIASLDPFGVGIEMEADKPNWFDALNGLPALFGSSSCETFELKRMIILLKDTLADTKVQKFALSEEISDFLLKLGTLLEEHLSSSDSDKDYIYWDKSYSLKEEYRQRTKFGLSGKEIDISSAQFLTILEYALKKIDSGLKKAKDPAKDMYYGYFINEVKDFTRASDNNILPTKFKQRKVPFFLEGQMHALRLAENSADAITLYKATKNSDLFDKKLKMYRVTSPLSDMPEEIGRCRAFTPGWLENESIWLHMEYKYLLELLEQGLYEEFYADFKNVLVPFQKPKVYGRSILENSSFIVSSAFPYKELQGNGFVARLSGSTAEFIHMWLLMNIGKKPFFLNQKNELNLKFSPKLVGWLFTRKEKNYSFNLLGKIAVTYHNPKKKDTFGGDAVKVRRIAFLDTNNKLIQIQSDTIPAPYAEQIRNIQITNIDIELQ